MLQPRQLRLQRLLDGLLLLQLPHEVLAERGLLHVLAREVALEGLVVRSLEDEGHVGEELVLVLRHHGDRRLVRHALSELHEGRAHVHWDHLLTAGVGRQLGILELLADVNWEVLEVKAEVLLLLEVMKIALQAVERV